MHERESVITQLEHVAKDMWSSGECAAWLDGAEPHVKEVSATVCGPMLEMLAETLQYKDTACVEQFRTGGRNLPCAAYCSKSPTVRQ